MTDEELSDAIDGLYAYDIGSIDSGIHDTALKAKVEAELAKPHADARVWRILIALNLSAEGRSNRYTFEDMAHQAEWVEELMGRNLDARYLRVLDDPENPDSTT